MGLAIISNSPPLAAQSAGRVAQKYRIMTYPRHARMPTFLLCQSSCSPRYFLFPWENIRKSGERWGRQKKLSGNSPSSVIFFDAEVIRGSPVSMVMALAPLPTWFPRLSENAQVMEKSMSNLQTCLPGATVSKGSVPRAQFVQWAHRTASGIIRIILSHSEIAFTTFCGKHFCVNTKQVFKICLLLCTLKTLSLIHI